VDVAKTIAGLGGNPDNPFVVFDEVKRAWNQILEQKRQYAQQKKAEQQKWEKENPELAQKYHDFIAGKLPEIDFLNIPQSDDAPTRNASANVLSVLAEKIENMIVASADLANSDKTDGFFKKTKTLLPDDFSGRFLQPGVAEFTMSALINGILIHGGMYAACGTFFVFSDYQKPALRMSSLQNLPALFIWSHDSYRVGEDGPTHQPVEQYAGLALMEQLKNHDNEPALLLLRPADGAEVNMAYKMALENRKTPSAIVLSRQNVKALPAKQGSSRAQDAKEAIHGGYIVYEDSGTPDIILLGHGSEVRTLYDAALLLKEKKNMNCRIVSMPSLGLFDIQPTSYKKRILPEGVPVFALTAGLPSLFEKYTGAKGKVFGLTHFGFSAPAEVLDEKFGFTVENICREMGKIL
jgi:transketolase